MISGFVHQTKSVVGEWTSLSHSKFRVHTSWQTETAPKIGFEFQFKPGWYGYFVNPGDSGTNLKLQLKSNPTGVSIVGFDYPMPQTYQLGPLVNYIYKENLFLPLDLNASQKIKYELSLSLEYLVCEDSCIPQFADVSVSFRPNQISSQWPLLVAKNDFAIQVLSGVYEKSNKHLILRYEGQHSIRELYPEFNIFSPGTELLSSQSNGYTYLKFPLGHLEPRSFFALVKHNNEVVKVNFKEGQVGKLPLDFSPLSSEDLSVEKLAHDYWLILIMAFIGGLLLNVMPCIFPVIALKLIQLVNMGEESQDSYCSSTLNAWMYLLGILCSFLILGFVLEILRQGGAQIGWGFQLQNPAFVACMVLLFYVISLNLAGLFEINISITTESTQNQNPLQSFVTGVLACVVATPCTAPFMATALGYALFLDSQLQRMLLFIFMGFGMAFPLWFIELFPSARARCMKILPKPGPWMITFRKILAYPMLLTSVWLLWVLAQQTSVADIFALLLSIICLTATLQLYQASFYWSKTWRRLILGIAIFQFILTAIVFSPVKISDDHHKFGYQKFNQEVLEKNIEKGERVLIIATADWCVSCKFNERLVLKTERMEDFYREQNIHVMIADWTKQDSKITKYLSSFNRAGVPLYVFYENGQSKVLPQILTDKIVRDAIGNSEEK